MQIVCPNCVTSYHVDASSMGTSGRSVRCARCRTVWFATDTSALAEIAAAYRAEMDQFATAASSSSGADKGLEWPVPAGGTDIEPAPPESDPADAGFVDDAPPLATDDSRQGDPP